MRLVMTMMVRDEADVISAMLDHHIAQGVDHFVITDNGSVDGTAEILEGYAGRGLVDLRHDPVHRKQQGVTVTGMARDAATTHGASWVLNADADEFWLPVDRSHTLHDVFESIPATIGAFPVPVVDMTGMPAESGTGLSRLRFRDTRPLTTLALLGLHAHSTPNVAHVGSPDVEVVQGNHFVNIESLGTPDPEFAVEVLHLPWRSWQQFRRKVEQAGLGYEASPDLTPSPNHHGMREWRRLNEGTLFAWYVARHVDSTDVSRSPEWLTEDRSLVTLTDPFPDRPIGDSLIPQLRDVSTVIADRDASIELKVAEIAAVQLELDQTHRHLELTERALKDTLQSLHGTEYDLEVIRRRLMVRGVDRFARLLRRR